MRTENVEEKKIGLTKSLKDIKKFKEMIEIAEKNFKETFEIRKENLNQIEKLKKDWWIVHDGSKDVVKSINDENEVFENNIININLDYNIAEDAAVVDKIENKTLRNIVLKQNSRNEHIKKNVFDENIRFLIE